MKTTTLSHATDFKENRGYEKIIADLAEQGFSVSDDFFASKDIVALRQKLWTAYDKHHFKKAAIGNKIDETVVREIRGDFIHWLNESQADTAEKAFFKQINRFTDYLNRTCFMGVLQKEFHYAVYPVGTYYQRHLDTFQNDDRRKLSFVCYLNAEPWTIENGGALVLYLEKNGMETPEKIFPIPGRTVIFESRFIPHEVETVWQKERLSITGWFKTR